jgi:hypothetical protein
MHVELRTISLPSDTVEGEFTDWVTLTAYEELKKDLIAANHDITQLRRNSGSLLDAEIADLTRIRQGFADMKDQLDSIAIFLRENYQDEIRLGQHNAMKDVASAAVYYMGRERVLRKEVERLERKLEREREREKGN